MTIYAIHYLGSITNYNWSIVTIHKTREQAEAALAKYIRNYQNNNIELPELKIIELDTDTDLIYDCDRDEND